MKLALILLLVSSCNREGEYLARRRNQFHVTWQRSHISCNKINWKDKGYTLTDCDMGVKEVINATNIIIYE